MHSSRRDVSGEHEGSVVRNPVFSDEPQQARYVVNLLGRCQLYQSDVTILSEFAMDFFLQIKYARVDFM